MLDEICSALGGRAAEDLFFGSISTGALSDLEKITKQAYAMVSIYGLSNKIGNISYYDSSGQQNAFTKPYSEERAQQIDKEVSGIIEKQYKRAKEILKKYRKKVINLSEELLEKEVIFKDDLINIFGERKWISFEEEQLLKMDKDQNKTKKTKTSKSKKLSKKNE